MYNNDNLIHGIGYPELTMYHSVGTGGVGVVLDPILGQLRLKLPYTTTENLVFSPEEVQYTTAAEGKIKKYRYGYRLSLDWLLGELEKNEYRKLIKMYNLDGDINRNYEMRLIIHSLNYAAAAETEARTATTPDSIFWRVTFAGNFNFQYVSKLIYKHSGQFGLVGSERIEEIPYIWIDSDVSEDDLGTLVLTG